MSKNPKKLEIIILYPSSFFIHPSFILHLSSFFIHTSFILPSYFLHFTTFKLFSLFFNASLIIIGSFIIYWSHKLGRINVVFEQYLNTGAAVCLFVREWCSECRPFWTASLGPAKQKRCSEGFHYFCSEVNLATKVITELTVNWKSNLLITDRQNAVTQ